MAATPLIPENPLNSPAPSVPVVSVVVPVYNEEATLPLLGERLGSVLDSWEISHEVILVDDGSQDGTPDLLRKFHDRDERWKVLRFSRNFGHQAAVMAGIEYARGDCIMILDGDLQDPPEVLSVLLNRWRQGYEVVYAIRRNRKEGLLKRCAYALYYRFLAYVSRVRIPPDSGDFCLIDWRVAEVLRSMPERNPFIRGLRSWAGFKQIGVEYERDRRAAGEPKYTFFKLVKLAFDGILSFSFMPLRLSVWFGFVVSGVSFLAALFFLAHRFIGFRVLGHTPAEIPGIATAICAVLFLGGVQLISLGILGEYVARIFDEVKQRPRWIVSETLGLAIPPDPGRAHWFVRRDQQGPS